MKIEEIKEIIQMLDKSNLADFEIKQGDFELKIKTKKYYKRNKMGTTMAPMQMAAPTMQAMPLVSQAPSSAPSASKDSPDTPAAPQANAGKKMLEIKSPIVGTFYRASGPDKPSFIKVGDTVAVGDVVCIIEAMKLFNEIESEVAGTVVKVLVEDASPVEYDQVLFLVEV